MYVGSLGRCRGGVRGVKVDGGELVVGDDEGAEVVEAAVLPVLASGRRRGRRCRAR